MELFVKINFGLGILLFVMRIFECALMDWPHERKPKSLGLHIAETMLGLAVVIWCALLLFYR